MYILKRSTKEEKKWIYLGQQENKCERGCPLDYYIAA